MASPYCTSADIKDALGGKSRLQQLSDWNNDGFPNQNVINDAIAAAEQRINGYMPPQHAIPLDPVPTEIKRLCVREAIYEMKTAPGRVSATQDDRDDHTERMEWLEMVMRGKIKLSTNSVSQLANQKAESGNRDSVTDAIVPSDLNGFV